MRSFVWLDWKPSMEGGSTAEARSLPETPSLSPHMSSGDRSCRCSLRNSRASSLRSISLRPETACSACSSSSTRPCVSFFRHRFQTDAPDARRDRRLPLPRHQVRSAHVAMQSWSIGEVVTAPFISFAKIQSQNRLSMTF